MERDMIPTKNEFRSKIPISEPNKLILNEFRIQEEIVGLIDDYSRTYKVEILPANAQEYKKGGHVYAKIINGSFINKAFLPKTILEYEEFDKIGKEIYLACMKKVNPDCENQNIGKKPIHPQVMFPVLLNISRTPNMYIVYRNTGRITLQKLLENSNGIEQAIWIEWLRRSIDLMKELKIENLNYILKYGLSLDDFTVNDDRSPEIWLNIFNLNGSLEVTGIKNNYKIPVPLKAPEMFYLSNGDLDSRRFDPRKSIVWAIGMCFYILNFCYDPFKHYNYKRNEEMEFASRLKTNSESTGENLFLNINDEASKLKILKMMIDWDPLKRKSLEELSEILGRDYFRRQFDDMKLSIIDFICVVFRRSTELIKKYNKQSNEMKLVESLQDKIRLLLSKLIAFAERELVANNSKQRTQRIKGHFDETISIINKANGYAINQNSNNNSYQDFEHDITDLKNLYLTKRKDLLQLCMNDNSNIGFEVVYKTYYVVFEHDRIITEKDFSDINLMDSKSYKEKFVAWANGTTADRRQN